MNRTIITSLFSVAVIALVLSGCDSDNDTRFGHIYLRGGKKVPSRLQGWVAVQGNSPKVVEDKNAGISYAILATHDVVSSEINGWVAVKPGLFAKMSGMKTETPAGDQGELYVLYKDAHIPEEMSNWIALPNTQPEVQSSATKKDVGLAKLAADNVIPKEMNGWVAISPDTLAKLSEKYMMTGKGSQVK